MKKMLIALTALLLFVGCESDPTTTSKPTTPTKVEKPVVEKPVTETPVKDLKEEIFKVVEAETACSKYFWKNRGRAPMAYMKGLSLMYAKQVCGQGTDFIKKDKIRSFYKLAWEKKTRPHKDALEYLGIPGGELNTYTTLMGLGMRESSGKYCVGRDKSQNFVKDYEAEAGLYQMAYVARLFNTELTPLYKKYLEGKLNCELPLFKEGVKCRAHDAVNHGKGPGVAWQVLMKKCPAASVQWAAILIRSNMNHFGPIKRKELEFKKECKVMLEKVGKLAKNNCSQLD